MVKLPSKTTMVGVGLLIGAVAKFLATGDVNAVVEPSLAGLGLIFAKDHG